MAETMKKCKSCGNDIAKSAKICPSCGAKNKKPIYKRVWFILLVLVLLVIVISAIVNSTKSYDYSKPEAIVTVDEILDDFNTNSATASEKYSDNVIAITGKVRTIEEAYVTLEAYNDDSWLYCVYVYFSDVNDAKTLTEGKTLSVVGICDNTTMFGDVELNKCVIDEAFAITPDYDSAQSVDAAVLAGAYNDNQVSADESYFGKTISFEAVVTYVADDYYVVKPRGTDPFDFESEIQVYAEDNSAFAAVKEDDAITIIGECYGKADMYAVKITRAILG